MLSLVTRRHIPEDLNIQQHLCRSLISSSYAVVTGYVLLLFNCLVTDETQQIRSQEADCRSHSHTHLPVVSRIGRFSATVTVAKPWSLL